MSEPVSIHFSHGSLTALNICLAVIMFGVALDIKAEHFTQLLNQKKAVLIRLFSPVLLFPLFTVLRVIVLPISNDLALDFGICFFRGDAQTTFGRNNSIVMSV